MGKHKNKEDKSCEDKSCSTLYMLMIFIFGVVFGIFVLLIMQHAIVPYILNIIGDETTTTMAQPAVMRQPVMRQPAMAQPAMAQPAMAQPAMVQPAMAQPAAPTVGGRKLFRNRY